MSENVVDLEEARKQRLMEELRKLPPYQGPVIDCRWKKVNHCISAFQNGPKEDISVMCFDISDGFARDLGVIRLEFSQWKELRNEIDRIINFCEKQVEK